MGCSIMYDQVEYIIHEFQHRFSNHGNIGIISSMLGFQHMFFKHLNIGVISSKTRDLSTW